MFRKLCPQLKAAGIVDRKHVDTRTPYWSDPFDEHASEPKVAGPFVAPGMKERLNGACRGVDARQVRSLSKIAPMTSQGEVLNFIRAAVLFGHDVFDMVG